MRALSGCLHPLPPNNTIKVYGTGATVGSNVPCEASCVTVKTSFAGVNYADVCVRWGLYESARK